MAIAGIKPVDHADWLVYNPEYYDREKVREILLKFSNEYILFIDDDTAEEIVDEFMESGE